MHYARQNACRTMLYTIMPHHIIIGNGLRGRAFRNFRAQIVECTPPLKAFPIHQYTCCTCPHQDMQLRYAGVIRSLLLIKYIYIMRLMCG